MMYFKLGTKEHKNSIISTCVLAPLFGAGLIFGYLWAKTKLENPTEEASLDDPIVLECEKFGLKFEACATKYAQSFSQCKETNLYTTLSPMRLYILIETLSLVKPLMVSVPHLMKNDILE